LTTKNEDGFRNYHHPVCEYYDHDRYFETHATSHSLTQYSIRTSDVARILYDKTSLGDNWTILKRVVEISPGKWAEISGKYPHQTTLLDTMESLLQARSVSKGFEGATVGRLYNQFKEQDYQVAGGSRLI
jgi:hypothetical protein